MGDCEGRGIVKEGGWRKGDCEGRGGMEKGGCEVVSRWLKGIQGWRKKGDCEGRRDRERGMWSCHHLARISVDGVVSSGNDQVTGGGIWRPSWITWGAKRKDIGIGRS